MANLVSLNLSVGFQKKINKRKVTTLENVLHCSSERITLKGRKYDGQKCSTNFLSLNKERAVEAQTYSQAKSNSIWIPKSYRSWCFIDVLNCAVLPQRFFTCPEQGSRKCILHKKRNHTRQGPYFCIFNFSIVNVHTMTVLASNPDCILCTSQSQLHRLSIRKTMGMYSL